MRRHRIILEEAFELILPHACILCGGFCGDVKTESLKKSFEDITGGMRLYICRDCLVRLIPIPSEDRWLTCLSEPVSDDKYKNLPLYIPFLYEGVFHYAIPRLKFGRKKDIGILFGILLGEALKQSGVEADLLVPVPLSEARQKQRGFNQAEVIGRAAAARLKVPFAPDVLIRTRNTRRQTHCNRADRASNVEGAFGLNPEWDIEDLKIILVDDVVTTGNTIHEAASALFEGGAMAVLTAACAGNRLVKNAEPF